MLLRILRVCGAPPQRRWQLEPQHCLGRLQAQDDQARSYALQRIAFVPDFKIIQGQCFAGFRGQVGAACARAMAMRALSYNSHGRRALAALAVSRPQRRDQRLHINEGCAREAAAAGRGDVGDAEDSNGLMWMILLIHSRSEGKAYQLEGSERYLVTQRRKTLNGSKQTDVQYEI